MGELISPARLRAVLGKHHLSLRKKLGQNFLVDGNIVRKIVAAGNLTPEDVVVEIGPGAGMLTAAVAAAAGRVVAVELDRALLPVLAETLAGYDNVLVVQGDALEVDFDRLVEEAVGAPVREYKVMANLPYYITTPLIMRLLRGGFHITEMVLMVQLEVAARMAARPGTGDYGALSVAVQYYGRPEVLFRVPRTVFFPAPGVDSAVVRLIRRGKPAVTVEDEDLFFTLVRGAFGQRRKTLANALAGAKVMPGWTRAAWEELIRAAGIDPRCRGETLGMQEFASLARAVSIRKNGGQPDLFT
ncbi:16S rRNA (adenine(1518)-N(6)/adenine(1519)-N(6))-dimethyltransferase RsmA [Desulfofundulus thermobenzoicus]|uniref:Ribosomal RNA small subunit methyltransferase A n=1 Tax=Desulfofundulus thermobenzoicus TaxID=29376 RepID=A0A6N7IUM2_9FIRM|nr:16S rRNA (adenine(1518)-N(6)/adenine(1519)-N(6))-dimethyltransferase RsmA [Desulfofundulus thermobenzoicus]MQL53209.1 16S rRNA (adenine(1518)-N(6)/adenine(1519)-N(6))-dimethyltransferase RsmA [Desulfofundulus thermobenzoicus]